MNTIRIGAFNTRKLVQANQTKLDYIAKIIRDNNLDIVALQEVFQEGKAVLRLGKEEPIGEEKYFERSLLNRLGDKWEARWGNPEENRRRKTPYSKKYGEGYIFLWNTDTIDIPQDSDGELVYPKTYSNYRTNWSKGIIPLIRDPFYGRFVVKGSTIEIRLINTHIVHDKPSNSQYSLSVGESDIRRNEFKILAGQIYPRINEFYKTERYVNPYTIILGDYNLNLRKSGASSQSYYMKEEMFFDRNGNEKPYAVLFDSNGNEASNLISKIQTVQVGLTTVNEEKTGLANNFDHFSYDDRVAAVSNNSARPIYAADDLFGTAEDKYERYVEEVSDHLPIIIELTF